MKFLDLITVFRDGTPRSLADQGMYRRMLTFETCHECKEMAYCMYYNAIDCFHCSDECHDRFDKPRGAASTGGDL